MYSTIPQYLIIKGGVVIIKVGLTFVAHVVYLLFVSSVLYLVFVSFLVYLKLCQLWCT